MGSPHGAQLTISPMFYSTMLDLVGPYETFVPKYERNTRNSKAKSYKIHIAIFICIGTGGVNLQVVESESTTGLGEAITRFAMEAGVPKVLFPDKQSGIEAFLKKVEITFKDVGGQLFTEHGIRFTTCPAQAHWQHGRVERVAKSIRESIVRSEFGSIRMHVLGWQTICKSIENTLNDTPIGAISKESAESAETLEVLCPNTFKFGRLNRRAPQAPLKVPDADLRDYTVKVQQLWEVWWRLWQDYYVEQLFKFPKWDQDEEEARLGDLVMFKRESSEFGRHFSMGKIDEIVQSHDKQIRAVWIKYKLNNEKNSRRVERDVKSIYKLMKPEDTTLHSMLERAWELVEKTLAAEKEEVLPTNDGQDSSLKPDDDGPDVSLKLDDDGPGSSLKPDDDGPDVSLKLDDDGPGLNQKLDDFQLPSPGISTDKSLCPKLDKPKGRAKRRSELELLQDWSVNTVSMYLNVPETVKADEIQKNLASILLPLRGHNIGLEFCQFD